MAYVLHTTLLLEGFFIVIKPRPWFAVSSVGFLSCICSEPLNLGKKMSRCGLYHDDTREIISAENQSRTELCTS